MSLLRFDVLCDCCAVEYSVVCKEEDGVRFCTFCGELLVEESLIEGMEDDDAEED